MKKGTKRFLAFLLAVFGMGGAFVGGAIADEYLDLNIGEKIKTVWSRIVGKEDADAVTEKTGSLTEAACEIVKAKGETFYTATEARFADQMTKKSKVTYTPLFIQSGNDGSIRLTYKSSVDVEGKTLEDLVTAKLNIESNSENDALLADLAKAIKTGDEATSNEIILKLSQNANIEVNYALEAKNNNVNISNPLAAKVTPESLKGLDAETQSEIISKLTTKDYKGFVVTDFELIPDSSNKGQISENLEDVTDNNGVVTTYCDLTAKNVKANITCQVSVGGKLFSITIKQGGLNFNLGRQVWSANGLSADEISTLINKLSAEQLQAALETQSTEPVVSYNGVDLGTTIKMGRTVTVSMQYGATFTEVNADDTDLVIEVPAEEEITEEQQQIEEQVAQDAAKAAAQVAKQQAAQREKVNYQRGQQYNRQATNRNMTTTHRR